MEVARRGSGRRRTLESLSPTGRARTPSELPCKSEQRPNRAPRAAAATPSPNNQKTRDSHRVSFKRFYLRRLAALRLGPFCRVPFQSLRHVRLAAPLPALVALRRLFRVFRGTLQQLLAKKVGM